MNELELTLLSGSCEPEQAEGHTQRRWPLQQTDDEPKEGKAASFLLCIHISRVIISDGCNLKKNKKPSCLSHQADLLDVVGVMYIGGLPKNYTTKRIGPVK